METLLKIISTDLNNLMKECSNEKKAPEEKIRCQEAQMRIFIDSIFMKELIKPTTRNDFNLKN